MNGEGNNETWSLSAFEQQCVEMVEKETDFEQVLTGEVETCHKRYWVAFQDSAAAIAQLYRDRVTDESTIWVQFQTAAGTVTSLYKESADGLKKSVDMARQSGVQKRNKELINWAKKHRRLIHRDDLLAYLSGKLLPSRPVHHHPPHHKIAMSPRLRNISPPPGVSPPESLGLNSELHTFREALARSTISSHRIARGSDLSAFITREMARHGKRPASPSDVTMDSPTQQKRPRYM